MIKNKQKLYILSPVLIFLMLVLSLSLISRPNVVSSALIEDQLNKQGYSESEIELIKTTLEPDQVIKISVEPYQIHVLDFYRYPHYQELIRLGYTYSEARLLSQFDHEDLLTVLLSDPIDHILDWLKTSYLVLDRLSRYQAYALTHSSLNRRLIVERVNANRDYAAYTHTQKADLGARLILINKYHFLSSSYQPKDLVKAKGCGQPTLTQDAADAYDLMCIDITEANLPMSESSSYRSYANQSAIYNSYLKTYGQSYTDTIAARPGFSEHQSGLAIDLNNGGSSFTLFITTQTYQWVSKHCMNYGFILRYPQGKEDITGYRFEPWHYRYVGIETAKKITELNMTLDEYILLFP
jgi:LAS superfamily LD-carboxypeptidase LdcB